jgi:hypothetical protein
LATRPEPTAAEPQPAAAEPVTATLLDQAARFYSTLPGSKERILKKTRNSPAAASASARKRARAERAASSARLEQRRLAQPPKAGHRGSKNRSHL